MAEKAQNTINIQSLGFMCCNSPVFAPSFLLGVTWLVADRNDLKIMVDTCF